MKKNKDKSELRVFINLCRELASGRNQNFKERTLRYLIDDHRHQELKMLLDMPEEVPNHHYSQRGSITQDFKYACQNGCELCVKVFLDRSEEKQIDLNHTDPSSYSTDLDLYYEKTYRYEHCLFAAQHNSEQSKHHLIWNIQKRVLDLLLRFAWKKGINIHAKNKDGQTLRDVIIYDLKDHGEDLVRNEDYTEATYKILKIDPFDYLRDKTWLCERENGLNN